MGPRIANSDHCLSNPRCLRIAWVHYVLGDIGHLASNFQKPHTKRNDGGLVNASLSGVLPPAVLRYVAE